MIEIENSFNNEIRINSNIYKQMFDNISEALVVVELSRNFILKSFIDFNTKFMEELGYSREELMEILPSNIFILKDKEIELIKNIKNNLSYENIQLILKTKSGKKICTISKTFFFSIGEKNFISIILCDIIEQKLSEKKLQSILNGIPDIIKVYNPDYSIEFFNEAGYEFYKKTPEEVHGKRCYEILARKERCMGCLFGKVVKTLEQMSYERYIPELNKFMDVMYNPILDENGELIFVVERLSDITEKKILEKTNKEIHKRYKQIVDKSLDALLIIVDNKITLANNAACNLFNTSYDDLIGSNIYKNFKSIYRKAIYKRFRNVILEKKIKDVYEFQLIDNNLKSLQLSFGYTLYDGKAAILAIARDITEIKKGIKMASEFQKESLQKKFPLKSLIDVSALYIPADSVSGDFYRIYNVSEALAIGFIIDVRGKGVSAALNISAVEVLCYQEVNTTDDPMTIVKNLNKKLTKYYEENYIAICCFSIDFIKNEIKVVGAGINQFLVQKKYEKIQEKIVEGPFLGMFENSEFSEEIVPINAGDKIFFFTDGLDFILDEDNEIKKYMEKNNINNFKNYIGKFLNETIVEEGKLKDDCTMIAIEIK